VTFIALNNTQEEADMPSRANTKEILQKQIPKLAESIADSYVKKSHAALPEGNKSI